MDQAFKLYADIIKNMPIGLTVWQLENSEDVTSFRLIFINSVAAKIFGITIEEVIGKSINETSLSLLKATIPEIYLEVLNSGTAQDLGEMYYEDVGGFKDLFAVKIFPSIGNCVSVTYENITDRKWVEDLLQEARNYAESIVESVKEPLVVLNANLKVKTANKAFYETFKVTPGETENQFFYSLGNGQWNLPAMRSLLQEIIENNTDFNDFEVSQEFPIIGHKIMLLNGRHLYQDGNQTQMILLAIEDITERKQAQIALEESEARFRGIVDTAQEGIWLLDLQGNTTYVNQRMADMLGYTKEEMFEQPFFNFMDGSAYMEAEYYFERRQLGIKEQHDFRFRRKDNSDLWAIVSTNPVINEEGKFLGVLGMITDITERKRTEEELKIFTAKVEQSNRELQDFAFVASHDLQEPLRKIQAFGDRLKSKYGESINAEGKDYLERMQNAARRMQTLINDLLTFSRVTTKAQPFIPVNLAEIVQEVLSDLEVHIQKVNGTIEVENLLTIDADPSQIRQLLQNLISNGLKFHHPNISPILKVRCQVVQNTEQGARNLPINNLCQIEVEDNGIGFEEKYLDRIFTVFQRLHGRNEYEGTGVGLAICRKIVERHSGKITAKSLPGKGAKFIVTLPIKQA